MKLSECRMGVLVCVKPDVLETDELRIGHVVGLADPENLRASDSILNRLKTKPGNVAAPMTVWPVVQFVGNEGKTVINFDDLDLFTAY